MTGVHAWLISLSGKSPRHLDNKFITQVRNTKSAGHRETGASAAHEICIDTKTAARQHFDSMKLLLLSLAVFVPLVVFSQNDRSAAPPKVNLEGTVADYKLIRNSDPAQLQRDVNEALKLGWQPLGTVVVAEGNSQTAAPTIYLQAMTFTPKR